MAPSELLAMAVNRIPSLKPLEKFRVMALGPGVDRFADLTRADLEQILNRPVKERLQPGQWYLEEARKDRKGLTRGRFQCTFYWSREYPPQLREIYDPPLLLYHRGDLPEWNRPLVAIVGTRHPTGQARQSAYGLARELAGLCLTTVSGLARGIDAEAHRGSSDGGGRSIAVLGNGVDILFPGSSAKVGRSLLARGGALLSEYPPADPPLARNFPARNRIISGLARTTVVVQAPLRSGALITADYALEQGRELVIHRVGTKGERGAGSGALAEQGAAIIDGAADILRDWGWKQGARQRARSAGEAGATGDVGEQLAAALEKELAGGAVLRGGNFVV